MDMQDVKNLTIPDGSVKTIHNKNGVLLWGSVGYDTKYGGDTSQLGTPSPDSQVPVNVVTGVQNVLVHGKNLANPTIGATAGSSNTTLTNIEKGIRAIYNGASGTSSRYRAYAICEATQFVGKTLTMKAIFSGNMGGYSFGYCDADVANRVRLSSSNVTASGVDSTATVPAEANGKYLYLQFYANKSNAQNGDYTDYTNIQLEIGLTSSNYEPYQGANYTVELGSTELCKIGAYQDYIYKNGDDWYIHKEIKKLNLDGSSDEEWAIANSGTSNFYYRARPIPTGDITANISTSNGLISNYGTAAAIGNNTTQGIMAVYAAGRCYIRIRYGTEMAVTAWETKLSATNMIVYYALATPTDAKITDNTLIGQLNDVHEWLTRYGYNATVTGNLPIVINKSNL